MKSKGPPLSTQRILVTGGTGYIGLHLVKKRHWETQIRVIANHPTGQRHRLLPAVELDEGDIDDSETGRLTMGCIARDYLLPARAGVPRSVDYPGEPLTINRPWASNGRSRAQLVAAWTCSQAPINRPVG